MAYTIEEQFRRDIDWFFRDSTGRIFHVASAGGILPEIISEKDRINRSLKRRIRDLPLKYQTITNPSLKDIIGYQKESDESLKLYMQDFIFYAERGLFSYDKSILGLFEDTFYHLVAKPEPQFLNYNEFLKDIILSKIPLIKEKININEFNQFNLIELVNS